MTRREAVLSIGALFARDALSRMSVEGYIFQQYAARQKKKLADVLEESFQMSHAAGFHNIELNQAFFDAGDAPTLLRASYLKMPSVYVGGAMHTKDAAEATTKKALEIAQLCKPFGCLAVVNNPSPKPQSARKTDDELSVQAGALTNLNRVLKASGFELRIHHHTPELADDAREWRHILHNTEAAFCIDLDWVHQSGLKPMDLLREAGSRVKEIHVRNSKDKLWLEDLSDGDIDYGEIAAYLRRAKLKPLVVVELAYRDNTAVTRPLAEDLRLSRIYAEKIFQIKA